MTKPCLYICDRKKCGERCSPECTHTSDIDHAVNFEFDGYEYIEKDRKVGG